MYLFSLPAKLKKFVNSGS